MTDTRFQQRWWNLVSASSLSVSEIKALFASPYEKGSFIERTMCNISKIEPNNALMIIFMQKKREMQIKICKTMAKSICLLLQQKNNLLR